MGVILPDGQSPVFNNNTSSSIITSNIITIAVVHTLLVDDTQVRSKKNRTVVCRPFREGRKMLFLFYASKAEEN
jgi:hypothetical protein